MGWPAKPSRTLKAKVAKLDYAGGCFRVDGKVLGTAGNPDGRTDLIFAGWYWRTADLAELWRQSR